MPSLYEWVLGTLVQEVMWGVILPTDVRLAHIGYNEGIC